MYEKINYKPFSNSNLNEDRSSQVLEYILCQTGEIAFSPHEGRFPNIDGVLDFLTDYNGQKYCTMRYAYQLKQRTSKPRDTKSGLMLDCDTKIMNHVKLAATNDTAFYFQVDIEEEKIYWIHIDRDFIHKHKLAKGQCTISIPIGAANIITKETLPKFIDFLKRKSSEIRSKVTLKDNPDEIRNLNIAMRRFNNVFDTEFKFIKSVFREPESHIFVLAHSHVSNDDYIKLEFGLSLVDVSSNPSFLVEVDKYNTQYLTKQRFSSVIEHTKLIAELYENVIQNGLSAMALPYNGLSDEVLCDVIIGFHNRYMRFRRYNGGTTISANVSMFRQEYLKLLMYTEYVLKCNNPTEVQRKLRGILINMMNKNGYGSIPLFSVYETIGHDFDEKQNYGSEVDLGLLTYLTPEYRVVLECISTFIKRHNNGTVKTPWEYNVAEILQGNNRNHMLEQNKKNYLIKVAKHYHEMIEKEFGDYSVKYRYSGTYVYNFKKSNNFGGINLYEFNCAKKNDGDFTVVYDETLDSNNTRKLEGFNMFSTSTVTDHFIECEINMPLFMGIMQMLYSKISQNMNINVRAIGYKINGVENTGFYI